MILVMKFQGSTEVVADVTKVEQDASKAQPHRTEVTFTTVKDGTTATHSVLLNETEVTILPNG